MKIELKGKKVNINRQKSKKAKSVKLKAFHTRKGHIRLKHSRRELIGKGSKTQKYLSTTYW